MGFRSKSIRPAGRVDAATLAAVSPLPPPDEVFIDWLMAVPHNADIEQAARREVALIDRRTPLHPDVQCLRALLVAIAGEAPSSRSPPDL
jgi:hypothetical protein